MSLGKMFGVGGRGLWYKHVKHLAKSYRKSKKYDVNKENGLVRTRNIINKKQYRMNKVIKIKAEENTENNLLIVGIDKVINKSKVARQ